MGGNGRSGSLARRLPGLADTTLQLAWVIGGFVGIALPLHARLGLGVACAVLTAWAVYVLSSRPRPGSAPARARQREAQPG